MQSAVSKIYRKIPKKRQFKLSDLCLFSLVFLILFIPRKWSIVKMGLMAMFFLLNINRMFSQGNQRWLLVFGAYYLYALVGLIGAIFSFNDSTIATLDVVLVWFTFFVVIFKIVTKREMKVVYNACYLALLFISIYNILIVISGYGIIPMQFLTSIDATAAVGIHETYIHLTTTNSSMYIVLYPLFLSMVFFFGTEDYVGSIFKKKSLVATLLLSSIAIILTGRRILWLVLVLSWTFIIIKKYTIKGFLSVFVIGSFLLLFIGLTTDIVSNIWNRMIDAFLTTGGSSIRYESISALWDYFKMRPLLGYGFATYYYLPSRGWVNIVEVSYSQLLYNVGIVGSVFYCMFFVLILVTSNRIKAESSQDKMVKFAVTLLIGIVLLANATNPYVGSSFDFYIFIFLPLCMLKTNNATLSKPSRIKILKCNNVNRVFRADLINGTNFSIIK